MTWVHAASRTTTLNIVEGESETIMLEPSWYDNEYQLCLVMRYRLNDLIIKPGIPAALNNLGRIEIGTFYPD